jgi:zinc resistance-associated protein
LKLNLSLEENMLKPVVVAAAALAIAGSSIVYAQEHFGGPGGYHDGGPRFEHRHKPSAEDMAAFTDARIAALKAGLELTPDQAKNWPAFEQSLRDMAQLRIQRMQARAAREQAQQGQDGQPQGAPFERLGRRADNLAKVSAVLKRIADTGTPLYQSLNDSQKARFKKLARILRPHHHHMHARNEGGQHGWRQGQGYGRDGAQGRQWWRHHRFGQDEQGQGGRMHRMLGSEGQGTDL